jgi:DNA-binding FrmR family transcriptional regulator
LRCIAGHLRGVGGMVEAGIEWRQAVNQIRAVRRALNDVVLILLAEHLAAIVAGAQSDDAAINLTLLETKSALLGGPVMDDTEERSSDGPDREGGQGCLPV